MTSLRRTDPPARDRDPARAGGVKLDAAYLRGAWAPKGGDCRKPDFDVTGASGTPGAGLTVETSLAGAPRTGRVELDDRPAFRFDQPVTRLALESRGPDGLAVMPPRRGPVDLGGRRIEGDGRVYVKCN